MIKNLIINCRANDSDSSLLSGTKIYVISPKKITKNGVDAPAHIAAIVPKIRKSLSVPSAYLNKEK